MQENTCFRCKKSIESAAELSLEHKEAWLDNDIALFWDLENLGFSHLKCNSGHANKPTKKIRPEGKEWCSKCQSMKIYADFQPTILKRKSKWCRKCYSSYRAEYRKRVGKR